MRFAMPLKTTSMASWMILQSYQLYGSVVDDADIATRTQGTTYLPGDEDRDPNQPTLEVEAITDKIGKGNKVKYLVKWPCLGNTIIWSRAELGPMPNPCLRGLSGW